MSAKRTVARFRDVVGVSGELAEREANKRDPRFDSLCGTFDQKASWPLQPRVMIIIPTLTSLSLSAFSRQLQVRGLDPVG